VADRVSWPWLLAPVGVAVLAVVLLAWVPSVRPVWPGKAEAEFAALLLTPCIPLVAGARFALTRRRFFLWLTGLGLLVMWREIHLDYPLADSLTALLVLGMAVLAWRRLPWFEPELSSRATVTLLAMATVTYAITKTLDAGGLAWMRHASLVETRAEETLELLGHGLVLAAAVFTPGEEPHP